MATTTLASLRILVGADTSGVAGPLRQAGAEVEKLQKTTNTATVSTGKLTGALLTLGTQATGTNPALNRLAVLLGQMGLGTGVMAGVVAGAALVGVAWKALTKDARELSESIDKNIEKMRELQLQQAFGAKYSVMQQIADRSGEAEYLRERIAYKEKYGGYMVGGINDPKVMQDQLAALTAGIESLKDTLLELDIADSLELVYGLNSFGTEPEKLRPIPAAIDFEDLLRTKIADPYAMQEAFAANTYNMRQAAIRAGGGLGSASAPTIPGSEASAAWVGGNGMGAVASKFSSAVDAFKGTIKDFVKATFSNTGMANIGANLATSGIGFVAGKITDGVSKWLSGVDALRKVMEQNQRALNATGDFLSQKLSAAGLTEEAGTLRTAVMGVINRLAVGDNLPDGKKGPQFQRIELLRQELAKLGGEGINAYDIAKLLGVNVGSGSNMLSDEVLQTLYEQLSKAGVALDGLTDSANAASDALRNVPTILKVSAIRFAASNADEIQRSAARGGATTLVPAYGG